MTGFNNRMRPLVPIAANREAEILAMWSAGHDTMDIARALGIPEAQIYNQLPKFLERRRDDRRWATASYAGMIR